MDFEDIRPYRDAEVPEKIEKLLGEPQFQQIIEHVLPEMPYELFSNQLMGLKTVKQFQSKMVVPLLDKLLSNSAKGLEFKGIEKLDKEQSYLFVSTHRDIVLDSALMNYILLREGHETAEIAIGDNLMKIPWVVDLVKLNKSFIVKRDLPKEKKVEGSLQLSAYINDTLISQRDSIWIAQRSGRSKNGDDRTNPSILKMFILQGEGESPLDKLRKLNICPVSISYEYNPCDALTLPELMANAKGEKYEKLPMEDMVHMGQGIEGQKGRVSVSFGTPLNKVLSEFENINNRNELLAKIAAAIDNEIHATYQLMPTNYIAYDVLKESNQFAEHYKAEEKESFLSHMNKSIADIEGEHDLKRTTFLHMYANPVFNKLNVENEGK